MSDIAKSKSYWIQENLKRLEEEADDIKKPLKYPILLKIKDAVIWNDKTQDFDIVEEGGYEAFMDNGHFIQIRYEDNENREFKSIIFGNLDKKQKSNEFFIRNYIKKHEMCSIENFDKKLNLVLDDFKKLLSSPLENPKADDKINNLDEIPF